MVDKTDDIKQEAGAKQEDTKTTRKTKTEVPASVTARVEQQPQNLIYIGPTVERGRLRSNQIFVGGLPVFHEDLYEKYKHMKSLFIPIASLPQAQRDLVTPGHPLNIAYNSVKEVK